MVKKILLIISLFTVFGCGPKRATMSPLALQSIQTKHFENDKSLVFRSVISVFQDLGYIIESADHETGFITAKSATKSDTNFFQALGGYSSTQTTKATAFVEELRTNYTKVRLNFVQISKGSSAYGQQNQNDEPILDPKIYENAFNKVSDAIFIRKETN